MSIKKIIRNCYIFIAIIFFMPILVQAEEYGNINSQSAYIYEQTNAEGPIAGILIPEMRLEILGNLQDEAGVTWLHIRLDNGIVGYITADQVEIRPSANEQEAVNPEPERQEPANQEREEQKPEEQENEIQETNIKVECTHNVNIRRESTTNAAIIGSVPRRSILTVLQTVTNEQNEEWYLVEYNGVTGYISANAVNIIENPDDEENEENIDEEVLAEENEELENTEENITEVATKEEKTETVTNQMQEEFVEIQNNQVPVVTKQTENSQKKEKKIHSKGIPLMLILIPGIMISMSLCILLTCKIFRLMKWDIRKG